MWRHLLPRSLFLSSLRSSHLSSSSTYSSNAPSLSRRLQEESRNVKVGVWWDFDTCKLPTGVQLDDLCDAVFRAVKANGIVGPFQFKAVGDVRQLLRSHRGCSIFSAFYLNHIANGGESGACKFIIEDIANWVSKNPPPAHLILISGDEFFTSFLNHLRMKKYNIWIANNNRAPDHLCEAATITWHLNSLGTEGKLIGKHVNNPPHDSWYDNFKPPIEDDLSTSKYSTSLNTEEGSESAPYSKVCPDSESRSVNVGVWWDHDNCILPTDVNLLNVGPALAAALRANGIKGPVQCFAFGDSRQFSHANEMNTEHSGIYFNFIPKGLQKRQAILDGISNWVSQNPPPAHLLLISGDEVFASFLNHLRMKKYNILIANNNRAPDHLCGAATIMWHWNSLVTEQKIIGKHVNNPPHDTWYGHFKLPIEDDFSTSRYPTSLNTQEASKSAPDSKVGPASESVSESRSARVRVWWDLKTCNLPTGVNAVKVAPALTAALKANGINGPVEIIAFGDDRHLSSANEKANFWTGIGFNFIPKGGKNDVFKAIVVDLMSWVSKNPPPVHLFLISGDEDFAGVLHRLRMKNYNILLACIDHATNDLCSAATIMWHWNSLVSGEKLIGNHFNSPPDDSWYGHIKAPIEDDLSTSVESTSLNTEDASK